MIRNELIGGSIGTALSAIGTGLQTNDVLQTISLVITIIGGLITFIVPIVNWYKNAKKDGHIDSEEIEELTKDISKGLNEIGDALDEHKKGDK